LKWILAFYRNESIAAIVKECNQWMRWWGALPAPAMVVPKPPSPGSRRERAQRVPTGRPAVFLTRVPSSILDCTLVKNRQELAPFSLMFDKTDCKSNIIPISDL
jgi:hypothetical protein